MWIRENKMWSWDHAEIVGSRAKAFEYESTNQSGNP